MSKTKAIILTIILFGILSRSAFLAARPLHHDEGNNYYFANTILSSGQYQYNPTNFHGPTYIYSIFFSFLIFGENEFSLRFPAAVFGLLILLLPIFFRIQYALTASMLLLLSPTLIYYSRYSIHETLFVLLGLLILLAFNKMVKEKSPRYLPQFSIYLALLFATKETAIITIAALAILIALNITHVKKIQWRGHKATYFASTYLFLLIYIALFTGLFTNILGIKDSLAGFFPWLGRGFHDIGHIKPWYYYLQLISLYEFPLLVLSIFGGIFAHIKNNIFWKNVAVWTFFHLVAYSAIPYKMPWLVLSVSVPMAVLAAYGLSSVTKRFFLKKTVALATVAYLLFASIFVNVLFPWQEKNLLAYAHSDIEILELSKAVNSLSSKRSDVLVLSDQYWPLPFYLREYSASYYNEKDSLEPDVTRYFDALIVRDTLQETINTAGFQMRGEYTLRNGIRLILFMKQ